MSKCNANITGAIFTIEQCAQLKPHPVNIFVMCWMLARIFIMTICAIFDGRTQKECTRGIACRCEPECSVCEGTKKVSDGYEDWPCAHCNKTQELVSEGWIYEVPNKGSYITHFSCGEKPTDIRFLNLREVFSVKEG